MKEWTEPHIVINGVELTKAQAMVVRVALSSFSIDLRSPEGAQALGEMGELYLARLNEVFKVLTKGVS